MPGQHGQTYDPNEEPAPRGGWFAFRERPYPERLDRAFRALALVVGLAAAIGLVGVVATEGTRPIAGAAMYGWVALGAAMAGGLAYGFTRAVGMIVCGAYGTVREGSELVVDWRALRHDLPLRRTRVVLLELALLAAAMGGMAWGLILFAREGLVFGLAMFALINAMTFWPFVRRWMLTGRAE